MSVGVVALASVLSACANNHVVSSKHQDVYFNVPSSWRVYSEHALARTTKFQGLLSNPPAFIAAAVASAHPAASQAFSPSSYPWAIALVRQLDPTTRAQMSFEGLSDVLVNVDSLNQEGAAVQPLAQSKLLLNGSLRGTVVSYQIGTGPSTAIDYEQATWVNSATTKVWALMVGCSANCYQLNKSEIDRVIQSFYVADKGEP